MLYIHRRLQWYKKGDISSLQNPTNTDNGQLKTKRLLNHGKTMNNLMVYGDGEGGYNLRGRIFRSEWEGTTSRRKEPHLSYASSASRRRAAAPRRSPPPLGSGGNKSREPPDDRVYKTMDGEPFLPCVRENVPYTALQAGDTSALLTSFSVMLMGRPLSMMVLLSFSSM